MPGIVSISPAPSVTGVNTTASITTYGPNALTFNFSAPEGLTILPFLFNTSINGPTTFYPANSSGQGFNAQQVEEAIASGNYASSISVSAPNGTYKQPVPLLGGVEPETGEVVKVTNAYPDGMQLPNSLLNTKGISIEQYFQKECNSDATFTEGAYEGKTLAQVLGVSKADLTPEACDAVFHKNIDLTVSFGGKSYSFTNPEQVEELINSFETNIPSTNFTGYNGPGIEGPMQIHASLSGMAVYFLGLYFGDTQTNATFSPTITLWPSTQNGSLYSASGASIQVNSTVEGKAETSHTYTYQLFGNSADNFYSSSVPSSDLTSSGLISSSAPAGPLGLYFNVVSQTGQPLTQVQIALQFEGATGNGLSGYGGDYIWPAYWNPSNVNDDNVGDNYPYDGPNSLDLSSTSPYKYYGWSVSGNIPETGAAADQTMANYSQAMFTAYSIPGHPGCFAFSGLPAGSYEVTVGSDAQGYSLSTFNVTLGSYSSPETFTSYIDPDGGVNSSTDTIVTNSILPNTYFLYTDGKAAYNASTGNTPSLSQSVGSANVFDYQLSTYLPYCPFQMFFISWQGYNLDLSDMKIAGIPFSVLKEHGASLWEKLLKLNSSAISYIEQNGYLPATPSQAGGTSKIALSSGLYNRTLSITIPTYITPTFSTGNQVWINFSYAGNGQIGGGQNIQDGNFPAATTNGPADNSVPSSLTTSAPSSSTGLWFKSLNSDGTPSSGSKFLIQNSSGKYLVEDTSPSGTFAGWSWTSTPSASTEFSQRNANAVFSFGGLQNGTYTVTQTAWAAYMGSSAPEPGTGKQNWPGISPDLPAGGPDWAGYPGHLGGKAGYNGSFQVTLSYSSPEAMATQADPAGLVDTSQDAVYSLSPIKMAPLINSSLSTDAYQTETVGIPFEEGWEGYLPIANTSPSSTPGGAYYSSSIQVSIDEDVNGLEMENPSTSNIKVAGVALSSLVSNGAAVSSSNGIYSITLPYQALEYLEENGKNAQGESISSSQNRLIIISFPALMQTSFKNGGTFRQWVAIGGITVSNGVASSQNAWWNQNAGSGWYVSSSPLYTNGPADNSLPSSLSPSQNSSQTGIWFKSLWLGTTTPATGAKFTVQNSSGEYLTPITNSSGSFEGWSYSKTAYDFEEQNSSAVFSFGGLANGTYTVSEVSAATGATSSSMSFTGELSYSSPQILTSLSDPMDLLSSKNAVVYNVSIPSHLPFTGGNRILILSIAAPLLLLAGAITLFLLKKVKKRGEKR
ncbi:MAG: hypothetical protein J6S25_02805 [Aeriscardovia sp.]|nr:hypothetical protein [Aeriscardovia sp.]